MTVRIDREKKIAVLKIHGTTTLLNIHETVKALLSHPDHEDGMDELWDYREASLANFTIDDLLSIASLLLQHRDQLGRRVALVVGRDLEYGIGQMWQAFAAETAPRERRLFWCMEEAFAWLAPPTPLH